MTVETERGATLPDAISSLVSSAQATAKAEQRARAAEAEVERQARIIDAVRALVVACEERSPLGLDFERRHPEATPSLLIPARDLRAILDPAPETPTQEETP